MNKAFWAVFVVGVGLVSVAFIFFFQNATNTEEQNYALLQEVTEAAMYDAVDWAEYRSSGTVRINREKFVENFVRRFADSAASATYEIEIYDVNELPPKVSIQVTSKVTGGAFGKNETYEITQTLDAILESPYDELN